MFQKNIEAIRPKNPKLAEKLEKIDLESIQDDITVAEAETKDPIIAYKDMALHSTFDPIREASALWNRTVRAELKKNDIQVVFGLGLGYLFKRAYVSANSKIIIFEPFIEILRFVLEHVDLSVELSDKRVFITDDVKELGDKLKKEYLKGDRTEFLYLPAYTALAQDCMKDLTTKIVTVMEEKSSDVNTIFKLAAAWTFNFIYNLPKMNEFRPLGFFQDIFAGKTALIAAAGPSLTENIDKIKANRDKFVILAVGKVLRVLIENDIEPDFVTFADASGMISQFEGLEKNIENTNLILTAKSDAMVSHLKSKSKLLYLTETDPFTNLFTQNSSINPGCYQSASSVSLINYFIARILGFNTIAFAGLDLAFPDNKIYATGDTYEIDTNGYIRGEGIRANERKLEYVKDKNGNTLATRDDYLLFIRQLEEILEEDNSLARVINTSTKGAYIEGMDYVEFEEFANSLDKQEIDINATLFPVCEKTNQAWTDCVEKVSNEIYGKIPTLRKVREKGINVLDELNNIIAKLESEPGALLDFIKIDELKQKLNEFRSEIINETVLQSSLQGVLWMYTRDYKTENLMDRQVILHNFKVERDLLTTAEGYSQHLIEILEQSLKNSKELNHT